MKLLFLLITATSLLFCAPAFHGKKSFQLENGDTFTGYVKGDEHLNWIESESGEILLFNKENSRYEYAEIRDNEIIASGVEKGVANRQRRTPNAVSKEELYKLWKKKRSDKFQHRGK